MAKLNLRVLCALDRDAHRVLRRHAPRTDAAHHDRAVVEALGRSVREVDPVPYVDATQFLAAVAEREPDVVFNLAFSAVEEEAAFAGLLALCEVPYTGAPAIGIGLANDKVRARHLLRAAGLDVPNFVELGPGRASASFDFPPPYFVKPARFTGSSQGVYAGSLVESARAAERVAARIWQRFATAAICDEFIVGRELRVGVIGDPDAPGVFRLAGVTECVFPNAREGWGFKSEAVRMNPRVRRAHGVHSVRARLSPRVRRALTDVAQSTMTALALRGYATLDVRVDGEGRLVVVDVNANPGLSARSLIWGRPTLVANLKQILRVALADFESQA